MVAKISVGFAPFNKLLLGRLNGGFKLGELITFAAHLSPRPLSRDSVEFLEATMVRSREAKVNAQG